MAIVYRNVEYPSASAALLAYISQFDGEAQGICSPSSSSSAAPAVSPLAKYDHELLELFGTPVTTSKRSPPNANLAPHSQNTEASSSKHAFTPVTSSNPLPASLSMVAPSLVVNAQHPVEFDGNLRHSTTDVQRPVITSAVASGGGDVCQSQSQGQHVLNSGSAASLPVSNDYLFASGVSSAFSVASHSIGQGHFQDYSLLPGIEARSASVANNWQQMPSANRSQAIHATRDNSLQLSSHTFPHSQLPVSGDALSNHNASLSVGADISAIAPIHIADSQHAANRYPLTSDWSAVTGLPAAASVSGAKSEVSSILQGLMDGRYVSSAANDVARNNRNVLLDPKVVSTPKRPIDTVVQTSHNSTFTLPEAALHSQAGLLHVGGGSSNAFYSPKLYDVNDVDAILARNNRRSDALLSDVNDTQQQSVVNTLGGPRGVGYCDSIVRKYLDFDEQFSTASGRENGARNVLHIGSATGTSADNSRYDGFLAKFTQEVDESASSVASNQWPVHGSGSGTLNSRRNINTNSNWPPTYDSQTARYGDEDLYSRHQAARGEVTPPRVASPATESGLSGARSWELSPPLLRAAQLLGDIPEDEPPPMMESLKNMLFTAQQFTSSTSSRDDRQHPVAYSNGNSSLLHNHTHNQSANESAQSSSDGITSPAPVGEEYLYKAMHHLSQLKLLMKPN